MVRRCIVPLCSSTDTTTLVHRFPRKHCATWQKSLQLHSYPVKDLLEKFVVCCHHFRVSDYRHKESKHLNTTAIPTLDAIPASEKVTDIRSVENRNDQNLQLTMTRNTLTTKTQTYSNCVTLSNASPMETNLAKVGDSTDTTAFIENQYSDCDIIEEDAVDEEIALESHTLDAKDTVMELFVEDVDAEYMARVGSDSDGDERPTPRNDFVELIETNDSESDDEHTRLNEIDAEQANDEELTFKDHSRTDLINELVDARKRIKELETKLENIQKAHLAMIQNLNNFNKVLIS